MKLIFIPLSLGTIPALLILVGGYFVTGYFKDLFEVMKLKKQYQNSPYFKHTEKESNILVLIIGLVAIVLGIGGIFLLISLKDKLFI